AREDQHGGVDRAVLHVEVLVGVRVDLGVVVAVEHVRDEQRREEQHLLGEEQPDAELAGVELMLRVVVVVLDERVAAVAVLVASFAGVEIVVGVWLVGLIGGHLCSVCSAGGSVAGSTSVLARRSQRSSSTSTRSS